MNHTFSRINETPHKWPRKSSSELPSGRGLRMFRNRYIALVGRDSWQILAPLNGARKFGWWARLVHGQGNFPSRDQFLHWGVHGQGGRSEWCENLGYSKMFVIILPFYTSRRRRWRLIGILPKSLPQAWDVVRCAVVHWWFWCMNLQQRTCNRTLRTLHTAIYEHWTHGTGTCSSAKAYLKYFVSRFGFLGNQLQSLRHQSLSCNMTTFLLRVFVFKAAQFHSVSSEDIPIIVFWYKRFQSWWWGYVVRLSPLRK